MDKLLQKFILLLFILSLVGCWNEDRISEQSPILTLDEAKLWFEINTSLNQSVNGRNNSTEKLLPREPDWSFGKEIVDNGNHSVIVPLKFKDVNRYKRGTFNKLLLSKDKKRKNRDVYSQGHRELQLHG